MTKFSKADLIDALDTGRQVLVACDFDGTLCRIARWPELVFLPEQTRDTLVRLSEAPDVTVAVVSGRRLEDVEQRVGLPLIYAGNHGLEIHGAGLHFEHPAATENAALLERACDLLEQAVSRWHGAWVERKRLTATVHYRNVVADEQHRVALAVRRALACFGTVFGLRAGKRALEVRPRVEWHKGSAVQYLREKLNLEDALCICIGDDVTDENMFRTFPDHLTIRVGWHAGSEARFYVDDPCEVQRVLDELADLVTQQAAVGA